MLRLAMVFTLLLGLACADAPAPEAPAPSPVPEAPSPVGKAKGKGKAGKGVVPPDRSGRVDPLAGLTDRDLCGGSIAQLLLKYDMEALQDGQCAKICCAFDTEHYCCGMDFPFNDVPSCSEWAAIRNELFARHGYPFTEQRWRDEFEDEPWYTRREDFDNAWLSPVVTKNVATLQSYEQKKHSCMP